MQDLHSIPQTDPRAADHERTRTCWCQPTLKPPDDMLGGPTVVLHNSSIESDRGTEPPEHPPTTS